MVYFNQDFKKKHQLTFTENTLDKKLQLFPDMKYPVGEVGLFWTARIQTPGELETTGNQISGSQS